MELFNTINDGFWNAMPTVPYGTKVFIAILLLCIVIGLFVGELKNTHGGVHREEPDE